MHSAQGIAGRGFTFSQLSRFRTGVRLLPRRCLGCRELLEPDAEGSCLATSWWMVIKSFPHMHRLLHPKLSSTTILVLKSLNPTWILMHKIQFKTFKSSINRQIFWYSCHVFRIPLKRTLENFIISNHIQIHTKPQQIHIKLSDISICCKETKILNHCLCILSLIKDILFGRKILLIC